MYWKVFVISEKNLNWNHFFFFTYPKYPPLLCIVKQPQVLENPNMAFHPSSLDWITKYKSKLLTPEMWRYVFKNAIFWFDSIRLLWSCWIILEKPFTIVSSTHKCKCDLICKLLQKQSLLSLKHYTAMSLLWITLGYSHMLKSCCVKIAIDVSLWLNGILSRSFPLSCLLQ